MRLKRLSVVACGPVWPTLTKAMPWVPQGLDNLAWWVHMAGVPVVAIGGILDHAQAAQAAQSGASGVCVVRGLGEKEIPRGYWTQIGVWLNFVLAAVALALAMHFVLAE